MLKSIFFMISPFLVELRGVPKRSLFPFELSGSEEHAVILDSDTVSAADAQKAFRACWSLRLRGEVLILRLL